MLGIWKEFKVVERDTSVKEVVVDRGMCMAGIN